MTVRHTPKIPNSKLTSAEWNAAHVDDTWHAANFTYTLFDQTIVAPANVYMEIDGIVTSAFTGFQACRSGSIVGGAINLGSVTLIAGCLFGVRLGFRLVINGIASNYLLIFEPGDPPKKSICINPGIITFAQDDIIAVRVENLSTAPCTIRLRNTVGIMNVRYDA